MSKLYDRTIRVTLIRRPSGFIGGNPQFFDYIGNATEIEEMRIRFEVQKHLAKEPNKATIRISNLAESTRSEIEKGGMAVRLHAGYDGELRLLFVGDLRRAYSKREGTDIVTTMLVADGAQAFRHARMNRSYKPPTPIMRVLQDMAKSMDLVLPKELLERAELKQSISTGITAQGATRDTLTSVLAEYGYSWSMQNGILQILRDEDLRAGEIFVINEDDAGLVGNPERTVPEKPGGKSEIRFDVLLYPELMPGSKARIASEFINLETKLTDVTHVGDNDASDKMQTSCVGRPL